MLYFKAWVIADKDVTAKYCIFTVTLSSPDLVSSKEKYSRDRRDITLGKAD